MLNNYSSFFNLLTTHSISESVIQFIYLFFTFFLSSIYFSQISAIHKHNGRKKRFLFLIFIMYKRPIGCVSVPFYDCDNPSVTDIKRFVVISASIFSPTFRPIRFNKHYI